MYFVKVDQKLSPIISGVIPAYGILKKLLHSNNPLNITTQCARATNNLLLRLLDQSEHAEDVTSSNFVRMLDAWGKPPERIFLGNSMWIGAYDECVDFQVHFFIYKKKFVIY